MTFRLSYVACGLGALLLSGVLVRTRTVGSGPVDAKVAPEPVDPHALPTVAFEATSVDLGEVMQDATHPCTFKISNKGKGVLRVLELKTCCGCTASAESQEVLPGHSCRLDVNIMAKTSGRIQKTVRVRTNDPKVPVVTLQIQATVKPNFIFEPPSLEFGNVGRGQESTRQIIVRAADGKPFAIKSLSLSHAGFGATTSPLQDGQPGYRIHVKFDTSLNSGPFYATLTLHHDRTGIPPATYILRGSLEGSVRLHPPSLFLGTILKDQRLPSKTVMLQNLSRVPIEVTNINTGGPDLQASTRGLVPGRTMEIQFSVSDTRVPGRYSRKVLITTSESQIPLETTLTWVVRKDIANAAP